MNSKIRDMVLIGLFAALVAVGAFIKVPIGPVPFSLQFLFVVLAGLMLGSKKGAIAVSIYVAIGLIGLPVFTKGGGFGYVFQPTFGYLLGFIGCAFLVGLTSERMKKVSILPLGLGIFSGLIFLYAIGVPYLYVIFNGHMGKSINVHTALTYGFYPFILTDIIQSMVIIIVAYKILPLFRSLGMVSTFQSKELE